MNPVKPAALLLLASAFLRAHDPITTRVTFTREVSRILQKRCTSCHGIGASIPLTTYAEARPWAKAIRDQVLNRKCPPWGAVHGIGEFRDDPSLTPPEIERLVDWVEGGAPEGDPAFLPHSEPAAPAPATSPRRVLSIARTVTLTAPATYDAIHPASALSVAALYPDGRVEQLIWVREFKGLTYTFRRPLQFPTGTILQAAPSPRDPPSPP